jgi:hypothetical protein
MTVKYKDTTNNSTKKKKKKKKKNDDSVSTHYNMHAEQIHKIPNDFHLPFVPIPRSNKKKTIMNFKIVNFCSCQQL